ncbi:hypothetical protein C8F04DRAFT_1269392 [Mycena alexandri]|uniref:Uncharacterized protein n=1 Tax=Mycena alexandri TaxID=1745969 RepID=A0AAD6WXZ7_9AGAR|nr:hypothetical protein C8F04DRAFT_1269392 [Mycena alexandri]
MANTNILPTVYNDPKFHDAITLYQQLLHFPQFLPGDVSLTAFEWMPIKGGQTLRERRLPNTPADAPSEQYAYLIQVGVISEIDCKVTPIGDLYGDYPTDPIHKIKYRLTLRRPDHPVWGPLYDDGLEHLKQLVALVCQSSVHLLGEAQGQEYIKMSKFIFEPHDEGTFEVACANWDIPPNKREAFETACHDHYICPLRVFDKHGMPIAPGRIAAVLPGCLVQTTSRLKYSTIKQKNGTLTHSVNALIAEVSILAPGRPKPTNPFSGSRPYRPLPSPRNFAPANKTQSAQTNAPTFSYPNQQTQNAGSKSPGSYAIENNTRPRPDVPGPVGPRMPNGNALSSNGLQHPSVHSHWPNLSGAGAQQPMLLHSATQQAQGHYAGRPEHDYLSAPSPPRGAFNQTTQRHYSSAPTPSFPGYQSMHPVHRLSPSANAPAHQAPNAYRGVSEDHGTARSAGPPAPPLHTRPNRPASTAPGGEMMERHRPTTSSIYLPPHSDQSSYSPGIRSTRPLTTPPAAVPSANVPLRYPQFPPGIPIPATNNLQPAPTPVSSPQPTQHPASATTSINRETVQPMPDAATGHLGYFGIGRQLFSPTPGQSQHTSQANMTGVEWDTLRRGSATGTRTPVPTEPRDPSPFVGSKSPFPDGTPPPSTPPNHPNNDASAPIEFDPRFSTPSRPRSVNGASGDHRSPTTVGHPFASPALRPPSRQLFGASDISPHFGTSNFAAQLSDQAPSAVSPSATNNQVTLPEASDGPESSQPLWRGIGYPERGSHDAIEPAIAGSTLLPAFNDVDLFGAAGGGSGWPEHTMSLNDTRAPSPAYETSEGQRYMYSMVPSHYSPTTYHHMVLASDSSGSSSNSTDDVGSSKSTGSSEGAESRRGLEEYNRRREVVLGKRRQVFDDDELPTRRAKPLFIQSSDEESDGAPAGAE